MDKNSGERTKKISSMVFGALVLVALSFVAYEIFIGEGSNNITLWDEYSVVVSFIPFLLIAALYGYCLSLLSFLGIFITVMITKSDGAFYLSIYLLAIIWYSLFSQHYWFKYIIRPFIGTLISYA